MHTLMRARIVLLGAALMAASLSFAEDSVDLLLSKMRDAYAKPKTARVVVHTFNSYTKPTEPIVTELTWKYSSMVHAKVSGAQSLQGKSIVFVTDGKRMRMDLPDGTKERSDFDLDQIPLPINLEAMNFWDWQRQLSRDETGNMRSSTFRIIEKETWNGKDFLVLEETAPQQKVFVRYFIDPKSHFIWRTTTYTLEKRQLQDYQVQKLELGVEVEDSLFKVEDKVQGFGGLDLHG